MLSLRTLPLICLTACVALLTGCANIQPKMDAFEQQSKRLGVIYAQVNKITPSKEWDYCNSTRSPSQSKAALCGKPNMNAVMVSWVTKGATWPMLEAVPDSVEILPGSIVILDMTKPYSQRFVSVASLKETDECHWDGKTNAFMESTLKKAVVTGPAFVIGALLPIPTVAYLVSTRNDLGGVVCNGWNYQEAYKDKDIAGLIEPF